MKKMTQQCCNNPLIVDSLKKGAVTSTIRGIFLWGKLEKHI